MTSKALNEAVLNWGEICLGHLAGDPGLLDAFLTQSGMAPAQLRQSAGTKPMAMGLMAFYAHNEAALLAMCETAGVGAADFMRDYARANPDG
ncbi:MAG: DUF3572 domain-containing protein [Alphaproteobacteria bacterium]|nr:DUF3572 domain-containing protein [Alphaproteobacteria bacterium]